MKKHISVFLVLCLLLSCCISMPSAAAAEFVPYKINILWENEPIFNGPGYHEFDHVGDVEDSGIYTIVQEVWDTEGYVWGQLKSGAGWVNLSDIIGKGDKTIPYIQRVPDKDQPIYDGAGYSFKQVGTVQKAANYTITAEKYDSEGNLWGRLKSGAGWIDLSDIIVGELFFEPYILYVPDPDQAIYSGAGYEYEWVGTIEKAGQYTIVWECLDISGNVWGKLKSGAGWINVTDITAITPVEPYLEFIRFADQPIFYVPHYDAFYAGTVEEAGTYTIISEAWDTEGNLWGELKSGRGWIDLTKARSEATMNAPVSAGYADENLLLHADYEEYIGEDSEIATYVAFRVYEDISDIALTSLIWAEEGYAVDRILHTLPRLSAGQPFVAALPFYGDMTTYGLSLTDADGDEHFYMVYISMRNGMLMFEEYAP